MHFCCSVGWALFLHCLGQELLSVMSHMAVHRVSPHAEQGADPMAGGWHLRGPGESGGRLSHSLSPHPPRLCLLLGLLSALFMSSSLREGDRESYLHSNVTFKSYKLLATINNLPADCTAHKNLGLRMCCIRMCVRIFSLVGFFSRLWQRY